ncbi:peptidase [Oleiphilus sp. HI0009]|nr:MULTISPECIES: penicillin-binding protein 1A [unclassified Oleiphilus]KZX84224.1 peptidase [Oleiphilus sp. HI0009]KZY67914.1 peptidase [Oleiphilus sp. HI0066]KZY70292.1 peptidase [Oleiphilus sp. HI0067]
MARFVRLSTFFAWCTAAAICGAGILLSAFYLYLAPQLPDAAQLKHTQLQTPMRVYTSDNKKIAEFGEKRRSPVDISEIPTTLTSAFIAAEDNRFYEHGGIDIIGLGRAAAQLIQSGRIKTGGSTITMQVAKNFFLTRERTFVRKFNEIFLAIQIEQALTKPEILELYLNKIYLGNRAYGVKAAAQVYYGKNLDELSLAESAMIAGLPKAPSRFNPIVNPDRAKIRRDWILSRMLELKMISSLDYSEAKNSELTAGYHGIQPDLAAPYVAEMARQKAVELFGSEAYTLGLNVYVTTDSELQASAQNAVVKGLDDYDKRHGYREPLDHVELTGEENDVTKKQILRNYIAKTRFTPAVITGIEPESIELFTLSGEEGVIDIANASRAAPFININRVGKAPTDLSEHFKIGDIIEVSALSAEATPSEDTPTEANADVSGEIAEAPRLPYILEQSPEAQSALISLRPEDGAILALSGGYNFRMSKYNRAIQAKRQPGSNFKAFIYLAALEEGNTAATLINDAPLVFNDKNLETSWRPENSSGKFYGPTRLREAFYRSRNLVSIRLLKSMGIKPTLKHITKFGFNERDLPKDLSLALGSAGITPIDVAAGYAMIANGGHYIEPYLVTHIENSKGETLYKSDPYVVCDKICMVEKNAAEEENDASTEDGLTKESFKPAPRIADARAVFILHSMMKDVIKKGTGRRASALKRSDIGGKTGTTNDQKDAWFSGFNTEVATSVWVGFDNPETLGRREYGSRAALPIWMDFMKDALADTPAAHLAQPEGIISVKINAKTGLRTSYAEQTLFEYFRNENKPEEERATPPSLDQFVTTPSESTARPEDIF